MHIITVVITAVPELLKKNRKRKKDKEFIIKVQKQKKKDVLTIVLTANVQECWKKDELIQKLITSVLK